MNSKGAIIHKGLYYKGKRLLHYAYWAAEPYTNLIGAVDSIIAVMNAVKREVLREEAATPAPQSEGETPAGAADGGSSEVDDANGRKTPEPSCKSPRKRAAETQASGRRKAARTGPAAEATPAAGAAAGAARKEACQSEGVPGREAGGSFRPVQPASDHQHEPIDTEDRARAYLSSELEEFRKELATAFSEIRQASARPSSAASGNWTQSAQAAAPTNQRDPKAPHPAHQDRHQSLLLSCSPHPPTPLGS